MVRRCEKCNCEDQPYYDFMQACTCGVNPSRHGLLEHAATCYRVRHKVIPFREKLRRHKQLDGMPDEAGLIALPADQAYHRGKGFRGRVNSGFLYAEKFLCPECIQSWAASQQQRRLYLERVASFKKPAGETYYQMLARN